MYSVMAASASALVSYLWWCSSSFFKLPQKLSIGALSKQFPFLDIDAVMPNCVSNLL